MLRILSIRNLLIGVVATLALVPGRGLAQAALSNGANHTGSLEVGGLHTWTFTANEDDGVAIGLGKSLSSNSKAFYPWIRLNGPDGTRVDEARATLFTTNVVQIHRRLPSTGTYTVLVANGNDEQQAAVGYVLTMAKTAGPYVVSPGDEGGPLINGSHSGALFVGDVDPWTVQAAQNDRIVVSLAKRIASGSDTFYPSIRLRGPDGSLLASDAATLSSQTSVQLDERVPLSGTYTVIVTNGLNGREQSNSVGYALTLSAPSTGFSVANILPVAGSLRGNGAYFRTRVQIHNPRTTAMSGRLVFHAASVPGTANDPSVAFTINGLQTIDYPDLLPALGVPSGLGSVDLYVDPGNPVPVISARIFSDFGVNGTNGFFMEPVGPDSALQAGDVGVLVAPADVAAARLNIGIRSLDTGASLTITVRDKNGVVRKTLTKTYPPTFFEQVSANTLLAVTLDGSDMITFSVNSGKAIIYGAQTDNKTQDPSVQYAKQVF